MIEQLFNKNLSMVAEFLQPFNQFFESYDTSRILILIVALLIVFGLLLCILVFYIKSVVAFIQQNDGVDRRVEEKSAELAFEKEVKLKKEIDVELEKELEKDIEMQKLQKEAIIDWRPVQEIEKENNQPGQKIELKLDWKKNNKNAENTQGNVDNVKILPNISYSQEQKELKSYIGLAIDMLSRGVDEFKVAQTIMHKGKHGYCEDDVLQMIDALNSFATLCAQGEFNQFGSDEEKAIVSLMQSDISDALYLIEQLMDLKIDYVANLRKSKTKEKLLIETSNLANLFGTLASLSDEELALKAFELSLEVYPENINSWSKIGKAYQKKNDKEKAIWAFENVLALGKNEEHLSSFANSRNMLSKIYYEVGEPQKATEYYNESKTFYDMIGINRHLDNAELEIIDVIEKNHQETILEAAQKFLSKQRVV